MFFNREHPAGAPRITGDSERHYGEPFFRYKKIDLGNGATPGGLRVQVTSGTKDCTWKAFRVTYVDSGGTHTQDITNQGHEFKVHGISAHPKQVFSYTLKGLVECTPVEVSRHRC
ncbi:hypothetical protein [Streptomyces sp. NPDC058045]|uniref:hypothetical protein n=1 Tax=Streptomyces sp. NPDC058045 TaxID=3346311 RepID=UPI0036ED34D6